MCKKILIVDDDSNFVRGLMDNYSKDDTSFSCADSLKRAGDLLLIDNFDLVIANSKVPGGSSLSLKNKISSSTEIFFISSMESDYDSLTASGERCFRKYDLKNSLESIF
jgi:DNA-binding response OmpR family regulator